MWWTNLKMGLAALSLVLVIAGSSSGRVIYVDANSPGPIHDGTSWDQALQYLQDALDEASLAGDVNEVRVADGTYRPDRDWFYPGGTGERAATFELVDGVAVKGGYAGYGDPNVRDVEAYETVLSGDLDGNDVDVNNACDLVGEPTRGENSYHVVTGSGTDANAVLEGFTVTGGNANGSDPDDRGGGMYNISGNPSVSDCTFVSNSAGLGGGMQNDASSPTVSNCKFVTNAGVSNGGGIHNCNGSSPTITDCTFESNCAERGGGLHNTGSSSNPVVANCVFILNSSAIRGAGADNYGNQALTRNCLFVANSAPAGAGMHNWNSSGHVTNCTFAANAALNGGGGMYNKGSTTVVTNCILWGNTDLMGAGESGQIFGLGTIVNYSCVQGWTGVFGGAGNFDEDPCFADPCGGDYHLKSESGRCDPNGAWVVDDVTSPCIDKGDPNSDIGDEPQPNRSIINIGVYGGTEYASMSLTCWHASECAGQPYGDATCDGMVNLADLFALKANFGSCAPWRRPGGCCSDSLHNGCICLGQLFTLKQNFNTGPYSPSTGNQECPAGGSCGSAAVMEAAGCPDLTSLP
jgi:hypothetical protein